MRNESKKISFFYKLLINVNPLSPGRTGIRVLILALLFFATFRAHTAREVSTSLSSAWSFGYTLSSFLQLALTGISSSFASMSSWCWAADASPIHKIQCESVIINSRANTSWIALWQKYIIRTKEHWCFSSTVTWCCALWWFYELLSDAKVESPALG